MPGGALRRIGAVVPCLLLAACSTATTAIVASILGTGAGIGADVAVEHWLNDRAGRTFSGPPQDVHAATLQAPHAMSIAVTEDTRSKDGWWITGTAARRRTVITLEILSAGTTDMQVIVRRAAGLRAYTRQHAEAVASRAAPHVAAACFAKGSAAMNRSLRRLAAAVGLLLLGGALSGCIIEDRGPGYGGGWCWWHPYACR